MPWSNTLKVPHLGSSASPKEQRLSLGKLVGNMGELLAWHWHSSVCQVNYTYCFDYKRKFLNTHVGLPSEYRPVPERKGSCFCYSKPWSLQSFSPGGRLSEWRGGQTSLPLSLGTFPVQFSHFAGPGVKSFTLRQRRI